MSLAHEIFMFIVLDLISRNVSRSWKEWRCAIYDKNTHKTSTCITFYLPLLSSFLSAHNGEISIFSDTEHHRKAETYKTSIFSNISNILLSVESSLPLRTSSTEARAIREVWYLLIYWFLMLLGLLYPSIQILKCNLLSEKFSDVLKFWSFAWSGRKTCDTIVQFLFLSFQMLATHLEAFESPRIDWLSRMKFKFLSSCCRKWNFNNFNEYSRCFAVSCFCIIYHAVFWLFGNIRLLSVVIASYAMLVNNWWLCSYEVHE